MPFKSEAQRKYLWANEPEIARDWTDTYGSGIHKAKGGRIGFRRGTSGAPGGGDPGMTSDPSGRGQTFGGDRRGWDPGAGGAQHIPTPAPTLPPARFNVPPLTLMFPFSKSRLPSDTSPESELIVALS